MTETQSPTRFIFKPGDILIEHDKGARWSAAIKLGQFLSRGPSNMVHVALAIDEYIIMHVTYNGIEESMLSNEKTYDVFRCGWASVGLKSTEMAMRIAESVGDELIEVNYNKHGPKGANQSIFASKKIDKSKFARTRFTNNFFNSIYAKGNYSTFCSGFVAKCYQLALADAANPNDIIPGLMHKVFELESHCYNPAYLWQRLKKCPDVAFKHIGSVRNGKRLDHST